MALRKKPKHAAIMIVQVYFNCIHIINGVLDCKIIQCLPANRAIWQRRFYIFSVSGKGE